MSDLIYTADLANSEPVVVDGNCNCNCGCHGIYWMPPPPPADYPENPPALPDGVQPPPPYPFPWVWPYPFFPPFPPPPGPKPDGGKDDGGKDDGGKDDGGTGGDSGTDKPKPPTQDEIQAIEKQIQSLTKKLSTIKCMIKQINEKKSDVIIKTECCSYNFGNIDTVVDGWDDVSYAQAILRVLYKEKSLISEKIKELAEKISEDVIVDGTTVCECENTECNCND